MFAALTFRHHWLRLKARGEQREREPRAPAQGVRAGTHAERDAQREGNHPRERH